jgi:hypothetical protein
MPVSFYYENQLFGDALGVKNTSGSTVLPGAPVCVPFGVVSKDRFVGAALDETPNNQIIPVARKGSYVLVRLAAARGATDKPLIKVNNASTFAYLGSAEADSNGVGYVLYEKTIDGVLYGYAYLY